MTSRPPGEQEIAAGPGRRSRDGVPTERSVARLVGVQALYQIDFAGEAPETVLREFLDHRLAELMIAAGAERMDQDFFLDLVRGVAARREEIDGLIAPCLAKGWILERIDGVLRAILRAGTYELLARPDVPPRVVINEYMDVAHAFFEDRELGFVNAVLDVLAQRLRSSQLEPREGEKAKPPR